MKAILFILFAVFMISGTIYGQTPPVETGVSQELARWRKANYSDVRYKLNITLEKGAPLMKGEIEIKVNLPESNWSAKREGETGSSFQILKSLPTIILDWRKIRAKENLSTISNVSVNGRSVILNPESGQIGVVVAGREDQNYFEFNEHLVFQDGVNIGENIIKLDFTSPIATSGAAVTRYIDKEDNAEYIYSLFVPSDASTAFPVFDQPDLKARFQLNLVIPVEWEAVSNTTPKILDELIEEHHSVKGQEGFITLAYNTYIFAETKPISTYVFAFAAGEFEVFVEDATKSYRNSKGDITAENVNNFLHENKHKIYVRKSQAGKFKQHSAEVFRLNREGVKFLESWFDYKFPFPKYDLVLIPEFPFGGMEHAGATFLREDRVIFPTEPTKNDLVTRANVIFHEAAHQWFGDTVTMKWFDDLWLKEGFAEFMAYKTLAKVMPEYNAWKVFYERNKQAAYLTDVTRGTTPIYQEIPNLSSAKSAYGNIVYRKAPSFLKQAEFYLGEKEFQTAVRAFLKKHEFANATWQDLVNEFETASKQDLKEWANVWVKQKGVPSFRVDWSDDMGSRGKYNIRQRGFPDKSYWKQKFKILVKNKETSSIIIHDFDETPKYNLFQGILDGEKFSEAANGLYDYNNEKLNELITGYPYPLIFPNYQDYGYGIFLLDEKSRAYVLENIQNEKDDFLRSMMWGSLWDSVRFYELAPEDYVKLVIKNLALSPAFTRQTVAEKSSKNKNPNANEKSPKGGTQNYPETDESTIATLLGRVSTAMNYYLSEEQAKQLAPEIEKLLINKIETTPSVGQKITYFRALQSIGSSEQTKQIFKDLLNGKSKMKNVELKTKDKFDLVTRLIILGDKDALNLLANLEKTETDDAAKRYAYAAKAGIATKENKAKYWNDFVNNKDLSENWIESAFAVFNTPRHSDLTLPYLEKALAELPNLKRIPKNLFRQRLARRIYRRTKKRTGFEHHQQISRRRSEFRQRFASENFRKLRQS